jgi:hypothetical protein
MASLFFRENWSSTKRDVKNAFFLMFFVTLHEPKAPVSTARQALRKNLFFFAQIEEV